MATGQRDVCFTPKSGHEQSPVECPLSARSKRRAGGPAAMVGTTRQRPVSAFTRPEATAAWSAAKSRSFWSAYVSANEAIARSK
jgi:hypothetical protein